MTEARKHPLVNCSLQPLPKSGSSGSGKGTKNPKTKVSPYKSGKGTEKGAKKKGPGMPPAFADLWVRTATGGKVCFDSNLAHGCNLPVEQGWCARGQHVCMGCHQPGHVLAACTAIVKRPPPKGGKGKGSK